ncbi:hypothetical protein [Streptomyces sp. NBC_01462]|uniref:hypothetical protein n=1 Tax=Streptomyces sp. NBC_01462 TaxID=2903876 RepID=UPI002E2EB0BE|nr:hypothetical protein [Streptomyces sp. NBC_01462]
MLLVSNSLGIRLPLAGRNDSAPETPLKPVHLNTISKTAVHLSRIDIPLPDAAAANFM